MFHVKRSRASRQRERVWTARAITSFPDPVSPISSTGTSDGAVDINDLLFFIDHYENGC